MEEDGRAMAGFSGGGCGLRATGRGEGEGRDKWAEERRRKLFCMSE